MTASAGGDRFSRTAAGLADAARGRLVRYARHETPTGDAGALDAFADVLIERYRELGGEVERVPGPNGDHVVARWGAQGTSHVLLLGHHDTVWPVGQLATMPVVQDDGILRGPGVFDMKGGLVVVETALEVLRSCGESPSRPIRLVVVADEEVGSPTSRAVVETHMAGAVAVLGLESPHPDGSLKSARMGSTRLRVEVTGQEAHAALDPAAGVSAIDELLDQLLSVREIVSEYPSVLCNVGTITGGGRTNVVPGAAHADIGLRFPDQETEHHVLQRLTGLQPLRTAAVVGVRILSHRPAWGPRGDDGLISTVAAAGAALGQPITAAPAAGAADTNTSGAAGIPTLDGFGPIGRGAHAVHECIRIETLAERAALLAAVLTRL